MSSHVTGSITCPLRVNFVPPKATVVLSLDFTLPIITSPVDCTNVRKLSCIQRLCPVETSWSFPSFSASVLQTCLEQDVLYMLQRYAQLLRQTHIREYTRTHMRTLTETREYTWTHTHTHAPTRTRVHTRTLTVTYEHFSFVCLGLIFFHKFRFACFVLICFHFFSYFVCCCFNLLVLFCLFLFCRHTVSVNLRCLSTCLRTLTDTCEHKGTLTDTHEHTRTHAGPRGRGHTGHTRTRHAHARVRTTYESFLRG